MSSLRREASAQRLVVDPVACDGIGLCSHLAPRLVALDRWGYAVVPRQDLTISGRRRAELAVHGCPRQALSVIEVAEPRP